MKSFCQFLNEASAHPHLELANQAVLAGDLHSALKHLSNHVTGKSRAKDAEAAKLQLSIKRQLARVNKEETMCRVCGQTPCNCTYIEGN